MSLSTQKISLVLNDIELCAVEAIKSTISNIFLIKLHATFLSKFTIKLLQQLKRKVVLTAACKKPRAFTLKQIKKFSYLKN